MHRGYLKLWRKIADSEIFCDAELLRLWLYCLLNARYSETTIHVTSGRESVAVTLMPGQLCFRRGIVANCLGISETTCRRYLTKLLKLHMVEVVVASKVKVISIVNWDTYNTANGKVASKTEEVASKVGQQKEGICGQQKLSDNDNENNEMDDAELEKWPAKKVYSGQQRWPANVCETAPVNGLRAPKERKYQSITSKDKPTAQSRKKNGSAPPVSAPPPDCILSIPLIKRDGEFHITQADVDEWQDTFQAIDVLAVLRRIRQWNIDNPQRRKTIRGIRKHITGWLGREQDRGHGPLPGGGTSPVNDGGGQRYKLTN